LKRLLLTSRYKLGVSKAFVVATVAQELSRVFEEVFEIIVRNAGFLGKRDPIAIAGFV